MAKFKLRGKELRNLGYPESPAIGLAINLVKQHYKHEDKAAVLQVLKAVLENPESYQSDPLLGKIAEALQPDTSAIDRLVQLHSTAQPYTVFGAEGIEAGAHTQMETAMRLPITLGGALMPDAHQGYGLPIGGVLATDNAVIPYGVGVDIGRRMCLSVFDISKDYLDKSQDQLTRILQENTRFGQDAFEKPMDDPLFERDEFSSIPIVKKMRQRAVQQIGSSGSGNHFVEFGLIRLSTADNALNLPPGTYLAALSHSGSRGLGANIARHYTKLAMDLCPLPKEAKHLAWLDLDSENGQEYWAAMNLAGDYASACHHHIHRRLAKALGTDPLSMVENHHNFAWKEQLPDGKEVIVHRKGATPAQAGTLGIIPGSMTAPGFVVLGRGHAPALQSAAHGAGRLLSRTKAKQ
ncbi:MAG: RtcB family protein, partial [Phaeodactylibacter sp.]|nr:RtcB family protein [Phaeodactylibacter sp.]